jgi:hypothetical protein
MTTTFLVLAAALAGVAFIGVAVLAIAARVALGLVLLPFRLLFWALAVPFFLIKVVLFPMLAVVGAAIAVAVGLALTFALAGVFALPLVLLAGVAFLVWAIVRMAARPATA